MTTLSANQKLQATQKLISKNYNAMGIFGAPGSGKTSLTLELACAYEAAGGRVLALDRNKQFGKFGVWPKGGDLDLWLVTSVIDVFSGMLILDDADLYMNSKSSGRWRDVVVAFRHHGLDIVVSSRRPQDIDTRLLSCLEQCAIFRTMEPNAIRKLSDWLGEDLADEIPTEKHEYLLVDVFEREFSRRKTQAMDIQTTATGKTMGK